MTIGICGGIIDETSSDPFSHPGFGGGVIRDIFTLARLHDREPAPATFHSLFQEGFPDSLYLRPEGGEGRRIVSCLRGHMLDLSIYPEGMGQMCRDYLAIYMGAHGVDAAGRMTRRGDDFVSCLSVLLKLAVDAGHRHRSDQLVDYLSAVYPLRLEPFLEWAQERGEGRFYGALAAFSARYCRTLLDRSAVGGASSAVTS